MLRRELMFTLILGLLLFTVPLATTQMRLMSLRTSPYYSMALEEYSGWEVWCRIAGIQLTGGEVPSEIKGKVWTSEDKFTEGFAGAGRWDQVDVDGYVYGLLPDISIQIDQTPLHVNWRGEKIPLDQPVETITRKIGNETFIYDLHLFRLRINVWTEADIYGPEWDALGQSYWKHEISSKGDFGEKLLDPVTGYGIPWEGIIWLEFFVKPKLYRSDLINDTFVYDPDNPIWAAILGVEVAEEPEIGQKTPEPDKYVKKYAWAVESWPSKGSDLNMFIRIGEKSYSGAESWKILAPEDTKYLASRVYFTVGGKIRVGAYVVKKTWYGAYKEIEPIDPYISMEVEVAVLTVHHFWLLTSPNPDLAEIQQDIIEYSSVAANPASAFSGARLWLFVAGAIVLGALLVSTFIPIVGVKIRLILTLILLIIIGIGAFAI